MKHLTGSDPSKSKSSKSSNMHVTDNMKVLVTAASNTMDLPTGVSLGLATASIDQGVCFDAVLRKPKHCAKDAVCRYVKAHVLKHADSRLFMNGCVTNDFKKMDLTIGIQSPVKLTDTVSMSYAELTYSMDLHPLEIKFGAKVKLMATIHHQKIGFVGSMAAMIAKSGVTMDIFNYPMRYLSNLLHLMPSLFQAPSCLCTLKWRGSSLKRSGCLILACLTWTSSAISE